MFKSQRSAVSKLMGLGASIASLGATSSASAQEAGPNEASTDTKIAHKVDENSAPDGRTAELLDPWAGVSINANLGGDDQNDALLLSLRLDPPRPGVQAELDPFLKEQLKSGDSLQSSAALKIMAELPQTPKFLTNTTGGDLGGRIYRARIDNQREHSTRQNPYRSLPALEAEFKRLLKAKGKNADQIKLEAIQGLAMIGAREPIVDLVRNEKLPLQLREEAFRGLAQLGREHTKVTNAPSWAKNYKLAEYFDSVALILDVLSDNRVKIEVTENEPESARKGNLFRDELVRETITSLGVSARKPPLTMIRNLSERTGVNLESSLLLAKAICDATRSALDELPQDLGSSSTLLQNHIIGRHFLRGVFVTNPKHGPEELEYADKYTPGFGEMAPLALLSIIADRNERDNVRLIASQALCDVASALRPADPAERKLAQERMKYAFSDLLLDPTRHQVLDLLHSSDLPPQIHNNLATCHVILSDRNVAPGLLRDTAGDGPLPGDSQEAKDFRLFSRLQNLLNSPESEEHVHSVIESVGETDFYMTADMSEDERSRCRVIRSSVTSALGDARIAGEEAAECLLKFCYPSNKKPVIDAHRAVYSLVNEGVFDLPEILMPATLLKDYTSPLSQPPKAQITEERLAELEGYLHESNRFVQYRALQELAPAEAISNAALLRALELSRDEEPALRLQALCTLAYTSGNEPLTQARLVEVANSVDESELMRSGARKLHAFISVEQKIPKNQ